MMKLVKQYFAPVLTFVLITAIGWFVLQYIAEQNREKLTIKTNVMAEQVGIRLRDFISTRLARLEIFRESMENRSFTEAEFRSKALLIQHELAGFQAINLIDKEGIIQWVTPLSKNLSALGIDLTKRGDKGAVAGFERARLYRIEMATPPVKLIQGGSGFATYLPIIRDDNIVGFVNGVFRIEELIDQCFGNSIHDFNYEIILAGQRVYLRGEESNFDTPVSISRYNFMLFGQSWELQIVPGSSSENTAVFMDILAFSVIVLIAVLIALVTLVRQKSGLELAEAYKTVEDSEIKFRTIFDKSPVCLLRFNQQNVITDWNREAASLFGFEFPPATRRDISEISCMTALTPAIDEALNGKNSDYYGFIEIRGRNTAVDARIETLISGTDQIQGGIILLNDVTEQNQILHAKEVMYEIANLTNSVKELPQLFKSIHKSLSKVLDSQNFYVALYDEKTNEFSYPYYQDEFDAAPPAPIKNEKGLSAYALGKKETVLYNKEEVYELHKKGAIELIGTPSQQWLGSPLVVEGKPIGVMAVQSYSESTIFSETDMGMMNFISDQIAVAIKINLEDAKLRESESMHRELSEKLSDSNNMKALLLDIISHDLKNPASVISGMADFMSAEDEKSEEIRLIKDSSDALLKVIDNTSSLARITLGEEIEMREMDISQLAENVVREFQHSFHDHGNKLQAKINQGIIAEVNPIIAEIFRNYLQNALKYGPKGKPVECGLKLSNNIIRFYVTDTGEAISQKDKEAIFHRRIQLETHSEKGSGLGLAIVKRIADAHQAKVGVDSQGDEGNTFYLELPKSKTYLEKTERVDE